MKIVATIARYLLALLFLVSGLDKLFHFFPTQPLPAGPAGQFMGAMISTKYLMVIGLFETVGGLLLLIGRYVPLALALLAPVIVNILLVGVLMARAGLIPGLVVTALWILVFLRYRFAFESLFQHHAGK